MGTGPGYPPENQSREVLMLVPFHMGGTTTSYIFIPVGKMGALATPWDWIALGIIVATLILACYLIWKAR